MGQFQQQNSSVEEWTYFSINM
nr:unnamed protein product [Callosobruchus analis]